MSSRPEATPAIVPDADRPSIPRLNWHRSDPEQRWGFRGGRYTTPNKFLGLLAGVFLCVLFYAVLIFGAQKVEWAQSFADIFLHRGPTQYFAVTFFFWAAFMLWMKARKLNFQKQAFELPIIPADPEFKLSPETARTVLERLHDVVDNPIHFAMLGRVERALSNLDNIGHTADVTAILQAQADSDESQVSASYVLIHGLMWAVPVLGFIGTVLGLGSAIGAFGVTLQREGDFDGIKDSLTDVTGGLATAFDTTLVALVLALVLQLVVSLIQAREAEWLDSCTEYCNRKIAGRLRLRNF